MSVKRLSGLIGTVLTGFLIVALPVARPCWAASLDDVTDTLSDPTVGATATHTVAFTTVNTIPKNGKIILDFPAGFDISGLSLGSNPNSFSFSIDSQQIILNKTANVTIDAGTQMVVPLYNIVNTTVAGASYHVSLTTTGPDSKTVIDGPSNSADFSIEAPSGVNITTLSPLPDGQVGVGYLQPLAASGGTGPYGWSIISGSLPSGLTLDSSGNISGIPEATGHFDLTVQAEDSSSVPQSATKGLTVTIMAEVAPAVTIDNKIYDKTFTASISSYSLSGVIGSDQVFLTGGSAAFASSNAGDDIAVSASGLTLTGSSAPYYLLSSNTATAVAGILPRPLTVTATGQAKLYDGDTSSAAVPAITSGSLAAGDTANWTQSFDTRNAGTNKTLIPGGTVIDGHSGGNYILTFVNADSGVINTRPLTLNGVTAANKVYDGTAPATPDFSGAALSGAVPGDSVTLDTSAGSAAFTDASAGAAKDVIITGLGLAGADAGNYSLTPPAVQASILKAAPVLTWIRPADITYPAPLSAIQLNATASVAGTFTYSPAAGTILQAGKDRTLQVGFVPDDSANYNNASAEVKINVKSKPGGDGGGGGGGGGGSSGGSNGQNPVGRTDISNCVSSEGIFLQTAPARSGDGICNLIIPEGTTGKTLDGSALSYVMISAIPPDQPAYSLPSGGSLIGLAYNLGPEGATFNPPVSLSLVYIPAQLPAKVQEDRLVVGYWESLAQEWIPLDSSRVDSVNHTVTAPLSHFSVYTILAFSPEPAAFNAGQLMVSPSGVAAGESGAASFLIPDTGETPKVSPVQIEPPGQFTVSPVAAVDTGPGPSPAAFKVGNLQINPAVTEEGQDVLIAAWVTNAGETSGNYDITLKINGVISQTSQVSLSGNSNQQVSFKVRPDSSGKYEIEINGVKDSLLVNTRLQAWYLIVLGLVGCFSFGAAMTTVLWRARKEGLRKA